MTEEDKYISIKFRWISFVLAVMVVLIHANSLRGVAEVPAAAQTFHATLGYLIWSPVPILDLLYSCDNFKLDSACRALCFRGKHSGVLLCDDC